MDRSQSAHSNKKGWNREILSQRNASIQQDGQRDLTDAEFHLTVGRNVQNRIRRGLDVEGYANQVNMTVDQCRMALSYANSSPGMIFQALVEDWSWTRIQEELRRRQSTQGG